MGRPKNPRYVRPKEPASGDFNGEPFVINPHEIFESEDPLVRAYPNLFKPVEASRQRPAVEQATAAPGEKRGEPKKRGD